jgi:pantoate--beta-alanine ligase
MELIAKINKLKAVIRKMRGAGNSIGFVPTMGALHDGHLMLVKKAREVAETVLVSVFVNPIQFGRGEDFEHYPRHLSHDVELLTRAGVDYVFAPAMEEFYPKEFDTYVEVEQLSEPLCGQFRPGHFRGVATVVAKLFTIVEPDYAFFGQKDAQQAGVVRRMARDLKFPVDVRICPIVREEDGLAMSSRNVYLSPDERRAATVLYRGLCRASALILEGERQAARVRQAAADLIRTEPQARLEYLEIVDTRDFQPVPVLRGEALIAAAVHIGKTRLIDNLLVVVP